MITRFDYINIAFYFLFIVGVGVYFARRSKNTSDYFRAGGVLPWWVTGASTWMMSFSAWTFTGAAAKMYESGPYVFGLYFSIIIPWCILFFFTSHRFRRMQVVTPLEAVRLRFGKTSQVFFTWSRLPFMLIFGGISLNAIAVFMAGVFQTDVRFVIIGMGIIITTVALLGGSFGVAASDFVQMFLIVLVTVAVSFLALRLPEIGGISGMLEKAPKQHYDWSGLARPDFILLWFVALVVTKTFEENAIDKSAKYLMARDDRNARLTLVIPMLGAIFGPLLWLVPPTVAAIKHPDMGSLFPTLKVPHEAAFLQTAADVLPQGMLGLLVCGIFAATMTSMDAGLNQGAGIFVRNFYLPVINPDCPERKLLVVSKLSTAACGIVMMAFGLMSEVLRNSNLFDLVNQVAVSLGVPISIPLFLGLFWKKTPSWAAWSTVLVGLVASLSLNAVMKRSDTYAITSFERQGALITVVTDGQHNFDENKEVTLRGLGTGGTEEGNRVLVTEVPSPDSFRFDVTGLDWAREPATGAEVISDPRTSVQALRWIPGLEGSVTKEEITQFALFATVFLVAVVCVGWFFLTSVFYKASSEEYKQNVDEFFNRLKTPVESRSGEEAREDQAVAGSIGKLLLIYGAFVASLVWIPNESKGRLCFLLIGGFMAVVGGMLWLTHRTKRPPMLSGEEPE